MDQVLLQAIRKAEKAGKKTNKIKRYPFPRNKLSHLRSEHILRKRIQTYNQKIAELLPVVLPFSVKKFESEEMPPQKDGTIIKIYNYTGHKYRLKLTYSLPHILTELYFASKDRQRGNINYPILGKDLKPVALALLNLSAVQKSPCIIFTLEDIASQIYFKRHSLWRQQLKNLILTIGTTRYDIYTLDNAPQISGTIGTVAYPGKTSVRFGIRLRPKEIFFSFNQFWLLPYPNRFGRVPYFILATNELKDFRNLPDYMKNGYLWLASHRYSLSIITPKIGTFLKVGFLLSDEQIHHWKKWGELRPKWHNFIDEMKRMKVLQDKEYLAKPEGDLTTYKVRFTPTKSFLEQASIDKLPETPEYNHAIRTYLSSMATHGQSAKWVLDNLRLTCPSEMAKGIKSGKFDSMVKKGYYSQLR